MILASDFQRVQILPGAIHDNIQVTCIDCTTDSGKVSCCCSPFSPCSFQSGYLASR